VNIPGRYLFPGIPGLDGVLAGGCSALFPTRCLQIIPYGTGTGQPNDTYYREIDWGNSYDMSNIPWGTVAVATFTDTSGSPTSLGTPTPGVGTFTCNNPWCGGGAMGIVDVLVTPPCNIASVLMMAWSDWSTGASDCPYSINCEGCGGYVMAFEGCSAVFPVGACVGGHYNVCQEQQIIHMPMDTEEAQPCGQGRFPGAKMSIFRCLGIPERNGGDHSTAVSCLDAWAASLGNTICTIASFNTGQACTTMYGTHWNDSVVCTPTEDTYDDPP
jgi:hypothetical protein